MGLIRQFSGFPREGVDFLRELQDNNEREWFEQRREVYQQQLLEPLQDFVEALGMRINQDFPDIDFDRAANGSGSLTRIYRDVRFSKNKDPYKTWMGMRFWHGAFGKKVGPGLFVGVSADGVGLYSGVWNFDRPILQAWRERIGAGRRIESLEEAIAPLGTKPAASLGGMHYKRVPRGFASDHPQESWLRFAGLHAIFERMPESALYQDDLIESCARTLARSQLLHDWLVDFYEEALQ